MKLVLDSLKFKFTWRRSKILDVGCEGKYFPPRYLSMPVAEWGSAYFECLTIILIFQMPKVNKFERNY